MKKKLFVLFVMLVSMSAFLSAQQSGNQLKPKNRPQIQAEKGPAPAVRGQGERPTNQPPCNGRCPFFGQEVVEIKTLSGTFSLSESGFPMFISADETYDLLISPDVVKILGLEQNSKLKVKGFELPGRTWNIDGKKAFAAQELEINGKTYLVVKKGFDKKNPPMRENAPGMENPKNENRSNYPAERPSKGKNTLQPKGATF